MRRSAAGGLVWLSLIGLAPVAWAQNAPVIFSAMGDVPYGSSEVQTLQQQIRDHNKYSPSEFVIHVGDIKSAGSCPESNYRDVAGYLKVLAVPTYIIPGDNEYNDCSNPSQAWGYWVQHFNDFEQNFCGPPLTQRQSVRHENFAFVRKGVLFVGINLVGGTVHNSGEWNTRMQQDADWVSQQFQANVGQVRAAVVFGHAGPGSSSHNLFFNQFRTAAATFAKPILYLHGDGHSWRYDKPFAEQNIQRLQVAQGGSEDPVQVTVGLDAQNPWQTKRDPFSGGPPVVNMAPCVNAGPDRTITIPAAASLSGKATDDGDPAPPGAMSLVWSKVSGPGTVTFGNPNAATTTATVNVAGTYVLRLTANDGQLQTSDEMTVVATGGGPVLSINDVSVTEGNQGTVDAVFTVSLLGGTGATVSVNYATAGNSAVSGVDFVSTSGTLSYSGSTTTGTITVPVNGDLSYEGTESFFVNLSNPTGAGLGDGQGVGTILDNDPPPPPTVASFAPASGPVGTVVTIQGTDFIQVTGVTFNGIAASAPTVDSPSQIRATVPTGATTGRIVVSTTGGSGQSATNFVVTPIVNFAPAHDAQVYSASATTNYGTLTSLRVKNEASDYNSYLKFEVSGIGSSVQRATLRLYCTDESPDGGAIYLVSNNYSSSSTPWVESGLIWNNAPAIGGSPVALSQAVGTNVWGEYDVTTAIQGSGTYSFGVRSNHSNSAYYNSKEATTNRPVLVIESTLAPVITSFTPGSGPVGTVVTINGSSFVNVTSVAFNGTTASIHTVDSPTQIRATVPSGATTGKIAVSNADGAGQSAANFTVILPPSIASFSPGNGPVGTVVTINGSNFTGVNTVTFNGTVASSFTVASNVQILATVPSGAGTGKIGVGNSAGSASSSSAFMVLYPPIVASFTPASGVEGAQVTIAGSQFVGVTGVGFNGTAASTYTVDSPSQIRATVPSGATTGRIAVSNGDGTGQSPANFTVILPPSIASFTPGSGQIGTAVAIAGYNLAGVTTVSFNGTAATSFTVASNVQIQATVPSGATSGRIEVSNAAGIAQSATDFVVTVPPPILSFAPVHDAQVYSASATTNYGSLTSLRVKNEASDYNSYLKFEVSGIGQVQRATLRLYCTDESPDGGAIYAVSNAYLSSATPWVESGLNWNNAPAIGGSPVAPSKAAGANSWIEWDVTTAIAGAGTYSFGVRSNHSNSAYYDSKEAATNRPELVIESGSGQPAPPVISSFAPGSGPVGTVVTINGSSFVNMTSVTFNGTIAPTYTVDSPTRIRATVPSGATTGRIGVATADGSSQSATDFLVGAPPPIVSFAPVYDAQVYSANATTNYGTLGTLRVRNEASDYHSYLKFEVTGLSGPAQSAKLRLYCSDASPDGGTAYLVSNDYLSTSTPWVEGGLNWNNAPAIGGTPAGPAPGAAVLDSWLEFDVTGVIQGSGTYSFGVKSANTNSAIYSSKEGANPPALVVTSGAPLAGPVEAPAGRNTEALEDERGAELAPARLTVRAYPNPSAGRLTFAYAAPGRGTLRLRIVDVRGRQVRDLTRWLTQPGPGLMEWDGRDTAGHPVASGVYLYRLELGAERRVGKVVLHP